MKFNNKFYLELFKKISSIRICEDLISKYYNQNEMKTPMHMSKGEELAVSAAVQIFGGKQKYFGYYRSHALYLSLIGNLQSFFGEMYGKNLGENSGTNGSMHILNPKKNLMLVSAIVASTMAPAVGSAYASLLNGFKELTISFFGDGATEEGVFHECLNFSSLKKLPIAFVCLNNELAVDVKIENRQSYKIKNLVKSYKIKYYKVSSFEIDNVCKVYLDAKKYIYKYKKPVFIEVNYYRHLQHIGLLSDFDQSQSSFERANYRSKKAHEKNIKQEPYKLISNKVKKKYGKNYVEKFLNKKKDEAEKIIKKVKLSRFTKFNEILKY